MLSDVRELRREMKSKDAGKEPRFSRFSSIHFTCCTLPFPGFLYLEHGNSNDPTL